jgi:molecular chaperone GrpE (heat shock protein)
MTHPRNHEPEPDILATLTGLVSRIPVSDSVKATRAAVEIAATIARQAQALLALQQQNSQLRERLATTQADADVQRQRAERGDVEVARLRACIRLLTEPDPTA